MREYIEALQAIWRSWQTGEKLDFRGTYYTHTLMTPMFTPEPAPHGPPPVMVAAVGSHMTRVAAEVADGVLVHGFTTPRYLREVTLPIVESGLATSGRHRSRFTISYPGLVATGHDDRSLHHAVDQVRRQIAFYGATPAYRKVLDLHGWGDLHVELHRLSRTGGWAAMSGLIDDQILQTFAVVGEPRDVAAEITKRFGTLIDRFTLYTPYPLDDDARKVIVSAIKQHT
jgi:probable F420-dependent oxidoreductase